MYVCQTVDIGETLALFMELQTLGDRPLQKLAFSHVIHTIRRMNQKHKNEAKNRSLQNILFPMLQVCKCLDSYLVTPQLLFDVYTYVLC